MKNNDILRRVRYIFNLNSEFSEKLFTSGGRSISAEELENFMRQDDDPLQKNLHDINLAAFLNGFILLKRGEKSGTEAPVPEQKLTNNMILKKLKIALSLKDEDIAAILQLTDIRATKTEINAFFRNPSQSQYKECKDQFLRNFLLGLQLKYKPIPNKIKD